MPVSATLENKNTAVSATLETKVGSTITWDESGGTWDENEGTWDNPEMGATLETKNSVSVSLENKN